MHATVVVRVTRSSLHFIPSLASIVVAAIRSIRAAEVVIDPEDSAYVKTMMVFDDA